MTELQWLLFALCPTITLVAILLMCRVVDYDE